MVVLHVIAILAEIFIACLPVFIALEILDRLSMRLTARYAKFDWYAFFDRKIEKLKAKEQEMWDKRAQAIDERDKK